MKSTPIVFTSLAALAAAGPTPTKEQLCVGFNDDFAACQRELRVCVEEVQANGQEIPWDKVSKCLEGRVPITSGSAAAPTTTPEDMPALTAAGPTPTKEQLCVGFNNDFAACQRELRVCVEEVQANGQEIPWDKVSKCLEGRLPAASGSAAALAGTVSKADIRVDINRDGIVDVDGTSDEAGKDTWTDAAGAIFLPNIGDSGGRCKELHTGFSLPNQLGKLYDTLGKCHDASDDTQRAPQNLAPMLTVPMTGLSDAATGTITVADEKSRALVRVFRAAGEDGNWEIVNNDTVFKAEDLKQGLTLGVDARDTRRADWDGRVKIDFTVRDGETESKSSVMLRVAPVLLHHHRQAVSQVFTSDYPRMKGSMKAYLNTIIDGIQTGMKAAGIAGPLTRLATDDAWAQDYFEPAYASMPGPNGTVVAMRVVIEGRHNPKHTATSLIYTALRGDGVGAVAQKLPRQADLNKRGSDFDAGGNLESIPPYELNGKKFPAGRIIVGGDSNNLPIGMDFFAAQELQDPIVLDSTWLTVKHVDEMVQAVPAATERGWAIMAVDAEMGLQMLRDAQDAGLGNERVISREVVTGPTIAEFLNTESNTVAAEVAAKAMAANIEILKKETGITDAEIHRVPALISLYDLTVTYGKSFRRRRGISTRDEAAEAALDEEFLENFLSHVPDDDETEAETATDRRRQAAAAKPPRQCC